MLIHEAREFRSAVDYMIESAGYPPFNTEATVNDIESVRAVLIGGVRWIQTTEDTMFLAKDFGKWGLDNLGIRGLSVEIEPPEGSDVSVQAAHLALGATETGIDRILSVARGGGDRVMSFISVRPLAAEGALQAVKVAQCPTAASAEILSLSEITHQDKLLLMLSRPRIEAVSD